MSNFRKEKDNRLTVSPFEKNLEVWRQLWRVIERSDIIVHILDARDPLAFRSTDLEDYIVNHHIIYNESYESLLQNQQSEHTNQQRKQQFTKSSLQQKLDNSTNELIENDNIDQNNNENHSKKQLHLGIPKKTILLLNKADFLTIKQRKYWAEYFKKEGIQFIFFSAYREQQKLDLLHKLQREKEVNQMESNSLDNISIDTIIDQIGIFFSSLKFLFILKLFQFMLQYE
jgi:large subunit GTPase 1